MLPYSRRKATAAALALLTGMLAAQPARAQLWIGEMVGNVLREDAEFKRWNAACMAGQGVASRKIDPEIVKLMRSYVGRAGAGRANVTSLYTFKAKWREWRHGDVVGNAAAIDDPFAQAMRARGLALGDPEAMLWSIDGATPVGIWRVPGGVPGEPARFYRVMFRSEHYAWKLRRIELLESAERPALERFCHTPGDIGGYRAAAYVDDPSSARRREEQMRARDEVWRQRLDKEEKRLQALAGRLSPEDRKTLERQTGYLARLDGPAAKASP